MKIVNDIVKKDHHVDLKKEFYKALKDEDFKNYVYSLNVEEEILYKYTFLLQDAVAERKKCKLCKDYLSCSNKVKGYLYTPTKTNNRITFSYVACSKCEEYMENTKNITYFDVSKSCKEASFKGLFKDEKARVPVIKFFKDFTNEYKKGNNPKGLFLTGSFGSGKTYMISALFNELSKKGIKSTIVYYPEFIRGLKSSFRSDYEEKFESVKKTPILLLDDIGAENCSGWNRDEVLSPILQYRMEEELPTFFTSNLNLDELEEHLANTSQGKEQVKARRIIERIKMQSEIISLITKNRRG